MKFAYLDFPLSAPSAAFGGTVLKPIIPIGISFQGRTLRYAALVDSRADFCLFDAQIGEYLGIDVMSGLREMFGGVEESNGAVAYMHRVFIKIGNADFNAIVGFSYDIASHGFGVLGQKGFFEWFIVKFDLRKEEIELTEHAK